MREGPSHYAGVAAALFFAVAMFFLGRIVEGISILAFAVLWLALALSPEWSTRALIIGIAAFIGSGLFAWKAIANERTGTAVYTLGFGRGATHEQVTRESSPEKFREATDLIWGFSVISAAVGVAAVLFYKKSESSEIFY